MAELQALELYDYALTQGVVVNQDDVSLGDNLTAPSETRECAVGDLQVRYYRAGEPSGLNTEAVVTVFQADQAVYEAVYDSFSAEGRPQEYEVGLSDLSVAQSELLRQTIESQREVVSLVRSLSSRGFEVNAFVPTPDVQAWQYNVPGSDLAVNRSELYDYETNTVSQSYVVSDRMGDLFVQNENGRVELNDLTPEHIATLQAAQPRQQSARETEVMPEVEPQIRGSASVLDSYLDRYGEDAPLVASVVALAQRGELFDTDTSDNAIVESYFYRVPDSTLIVNRVDTNDQYGDSRTFTVLDGDEPLFERGDAGAITFNNLTPGQVETLQAAQRDGANPLLVDELYFQADIAQALTNDGEAQARAILSQGDAITPAMVAELNVLMAAEESIRRQDQAERGLAGTVRYSRFTEQELNRYLSTDTIARQLSAQSPVVEAQAVLADNIQMEPPVNEPTGIDYEQLQATVQAAAKQADYEMDEGVRNAFQTIENVQLLANLGVPGAVFHREKGVGLPDAELQIFTYEVPNSTLLVERLTEEQKPDTLLVRDGQTTVFEINLGEYNARVNDLTYAHQSALQSDAFTQQALVAEKSSERDQDRMLSVSDYLDAATPEAVGARVYATYYRWADRNWERDEPEAALVVNGYRVESLGNTLGSHDPMPFQVVEVATERVVMDFTLAEGRWVEQPQTAPGVQPEADYTGDTIVVNALDERLKTQLVATFESPLKKAGLIASTYLNQSGQDEVSRPNGLFFQREYDEDGKLWRDLTFSADALSSEGRAYAIAQAFPDGGGMGLGMPESVERVVAQEFAQLVEQYEQTQQSQAEAQPLQPTMSAASQQLEQTQPSSLDQRRSQVEVQEPLVAGYESNVNTQQVNQEANVMVAVQEAPVQAQTEIDLRDLMSKTTLEIMETGKVPRQRVEVEGKPQLVDRTPEEGFVRVARAAYGAQNFCKENQLPHTPATELIAGAADRLSLNGPDVTKVLDSIDKDKCRPVMEVATGSQAGVWARIEEKYPEYAAKVPEATKVERAMDAVVAPAKKVIADVTKREVPTPVLKPKEAQAQQPTQFQMAVAVAAYNLQKEGVDRIGDRPGDEKRTLILNRSKDGNISVINKADNTLVASRNAVTGQVIPGTLPEGQDYTKAYATVVQKQTEKYAAKTASPQAKAKGGDGR